MSDADKPGVTLLAIDDDPKSLELIQDALSRDDLTILTSTDPAAGLELALERRPEIVLLDLVMPGIDGIAVLERILAAAPTTEVILITGHYSAESAVEAIRKGASDYLTKPLSIASPAGAHRSSDRGTPPAPARPATRWRDVEDLPVRGHGGTQPADAGSLRPDSPRGAPLQDGPGDRRHRHRQRTGGQGAAQAGSRRFRPVRRLQLLRDCRNAL